MTNRHFNVKEQNNFYKVNNLFNSKYLTNYTSFILFTHVKQQLDKWRKKNVYDVIIVQK